MLQKTCDLQRKRKENRLNRVETKPEQPCLQISIIEEECSGP